MYILRRRPAVSVTGCCLRQGGINAKDLAYRGAQSHAGPGLGRGRVRPVPGHHRRHRRDSHRSGRGCAAGRDRHSPQHGDQLRAGRHHRTRGPLPRRPAAARPVPHRREPRRVREPGARGNRAVGRPDDQPADHDAARRRRAGDHRHRRGAGHRDQPHRGDGPHRHRRRRGAPQQRPQLPRLRQAHSRRDHRAGPRRRRAVDQRPEGHRQQHLGGRRRLQQPLLRRAARRPAPALHLQSRRGAGGGGGRRRRPGRVRPLRGWLRQRGHQVGHQPALRHRPRLLQERQPVLGPAEAGRRHNPEEGDSSQNQFGFTLGGPLVPDKVFYFLAADAQRGDETKQTQAGRMDARLVDFLDSIGIPQDDGPIERSNDAEVALAKLDWSVSNSNLFTLRYSYTNSEQLNGTFDVDPMAAPRTASSRTIRTPAPSPGSRRFLPRTSTSCAPSTPRNGGRGPTRGRTSRARTGRSRIPRSSPSTTASACRSSCPSSTTTTARS